LIVGRNSKSEMIGVFLALLELIREKKILVHQPEALGELLVEPAPEEHRRLYAHASLHLAEPIEDDEPSEPSVGGVGDPAPASAAPATAKAADPLPGPLEAYRESE
jgi:hypothetical protein